MKMKGQAALRMLAVLSLLAGCGSDVPTVSKAVSTTTNPLPSQQAQQVFTVQPDRVAYNSLVDLAKASVAVITGRVSAVGDSFILEGTAADGFPGTLVTPVSFALDSVIAGDPKAFGREVKFVQLGGATAQVKTVNLDDAGVKVGDNLLLFLSSVNGLDVVTTGGPGGRFTISGQDVVDAAANGDGAAAEVKLRSIQSITPRIVANLGKNVAIPTPTAPTTTIPPGPATDP